MTMLAALLFVALSPVRAPSLAPVFEARGPASVRLLFSDPGEVLRHRLLDRGAATMQKEVVSIFSATGIDHVALSVRDIGRSRAFYEQHLGLTATSCGTQSDRSRA